jgi:protein-S-isoprenylcysteine O-methyltransferase Ste14
MPGRPRSTRRRLGGLLIAGAIISGLWAVRTMFRHGNSPEPRHPVVSLVVDGPFRFSRNPIYLSMTAFYLGLGLLFGTLWHVVLLPTVLAIMRRGVIEREEAYLERRFGDEYRAYTARVGRWL